MDAKARPRRPDAISRAVIRRAAAAGDNAIPPDVRTVRKIADRPLLPLAIPRLPLARVTEYTVDGAEGPLAARLYTPPRASGTILFLHGGGFALCGLDSHDGICARLAVGSGASVLSVAYRLAPEHPFPAATEDAYAAYLWLLRHANALGHGNRAVAVAGDSAGGTLAAVLCHMARDRGAPIPDLQVLFYPATTGAEPVPSRRAYANGYLLTVGMMNWFKSLYLQDSARERDPYYAPALAQDFSCLPPAIVVTAEFDPLRDEGRLYADRLQAASVTVAYRCIPGAIHGFLIFFPFMPKSWAVLRRTGREIRTALDEAWARNLQDNSDQTEADNMVPMANPHA